MHNLFDKFIGMDTKHHDASGVKDDPFIEDCMRMRDVLLILAIARSESVHGKGQDWMDTMAKGLRSMEWGTERLRELSEIPKPRERKRSSN